jgi:hypothetical protein
MGQQLDLTAQGEELGRLRRSLAKRQAKDLDQDARITALVQENLNLKLGLAALVRLLAARGAVRAEEIADLVDVLDSSETPAGRPVLPDRAGEIGRDDDDGGPPPPTLRLVGASEPCDGGQTETAPRRRVAHRMRLSKVPDGLAQSARRP